MLYLLKSKVFWISLLTISLIGAGIGYWSVKNTDNEIANAELLYAYDFRDYTNYPSVITVRKESDIQDYYDYFNSKQYKKFKFFALEQGQPVYVVNYLNDSLIAEIIIIHEKADRINPKRERCYIWHKFLTANDSMGTGGS